MKKIGFQYFLLSSVAVTSLLFFANEAKADSFAINESVELKDSNEDIVKMLKRGDVVEGEISKDIAKIEYEFGEYYLDASYLLRVTKYEESEKKLKEDTILFSSPNLFSTSLGDVSVNDAKRIEFMKDESFKGWQKVKLEDGRTGYITEASVENVVSEIPVEHFRFTQAEIQRDGVVIPVGESVQINRLVEEGYIVNYDGQEVFVKRDEIGMEKPVVKIDYAEELISFAKTKLGLPYVWGGDGGAEIGYDCSGFTKAAFAHVGIELPRTAATQSAHGVQVGLEEMLPGDLLYFETYKPGVSHVGIYIGDGMMIHSGGDHVQIQSIYTKYYYDRYLFSKRVL
ncbi:C40 family peptidase [Lysinibacillus sphaericus]|uniref:C40 family peptidase n=1 Tax=Lysinibacillus sphaericus TaxID=1421 RepID=UPI0018CD73E4|nr:C40 family peptidase [Lysinibacillus sphaericus]